MWTGTPCRMILLGRQHPTQSDDHPGIEAELVERRISVQPAANTIVADENAAARSVDGREQLSFYLEAEPRSAVDIHPQLETHCKFGVL